MAKMTLKVKVNVLNFQYQPTVSQDCIFGANLVIPAQIGDQLLCAQGSGYRQTDRRTDEHKQTQEMTIESQGVKSNRKFNTFR